MKIQNVTTRASSISVHVSKLARQLTPLISTLSVLVLATGIVSADQFADSVIRYECDFQGECPAEQHQNTDNILGENDGTILSLGLGGLVEVQFDDNVLTNSGDNQDDLFIFEVGADVEATLVAIRPTAATAMILDPEFDANEDGYYEIGEVEGGVEWIDIDAIFTGFPPGALSFDAVQLIDNDFEPGTGSGTHGADIDAVEALAFVLLGDVNGDGFVNLLDVPQFVAAISNGIFIPEADINGDGVVNLLDVGPFIALLSG